MPSTKPTILIFNCYHITAAKAFGELLLQLAKSNQNPWPSEARLQRSSRCPLLMPVPITQLLQYYLLEVLSAVAKVTNHEAL